MQAVLMAGGEGTRLRPITLTRPKPFVPVGGKPCIEHVLDSLKRAGVRDVLATTYYKPSDLIRHLGGGTALGLNIAYSVEDEPRGTAGGVKKCEPWLDGTFVVASGDVFADFDLDDLVRFHRERGAIATMALTRVENPSEFGIVGADDDGRITRFKEKPKASEAFSNLINAGIYVLEPEVLDLMPAEGAYDFSKQLFPAMLERGSPLYAKELAGTWIDIGRPADLLRASRIVAERKGGNVIAENAHVSADARLDRACLHDGAIVDAGAVIEDSILLDGARVEEGARVRQTILGANARVGAGAVLDGCVIGDGAVIRGGSRLSGQKLDPGLIVGESLRAGA